MITYIICGASALAGVAGLVVACWSIRRTRKEVEMLKCFDIWTSH